MKQFKLRIIVRFVKIMLRVIITAYVFFKQNSQFFEFIFNALFLLYQVFNCFSNFIKCAEFQRSMFGRSIAFEDAYFSKGIHFKTAQSNA